MEYLINHKEDILLYFHIGFFVLVSAFITKQLFNFLLRGFAPFIPSRPWVVDQLMQEVVKLPLRKGFNMVSIGSGRSGLSHGIEKAYPDARIVGIEDTWLSFLLSKLQVYLQRTDIIVKMNKDPYFVHVSDKDLIYLKLDVDDLREIDRKLRFECKTGTVIISNGFVIPNFIPFRIVKLDDRKGRFAFLGRDRELFPRKRKKHKKENKFYFYEIE